MPTYSYACSHCGHTFDIYQAFTDDALTVCPECHGALRKKFSAVGVVFKGSGFYRNDARGSSTTTTGASSGDSKESTTTDTSAKESSSNGTKDSSSTSGTSNSGESKSSGSATKTSGTSATKAATPA